MAGIGDIVLLFADESEALRHPYLARAWAKKGADLRVPAPGQAQKIAMMGSLELAVTASRTKRSSDFIAHLQAIDRLYGPRPGVPTKPVVLVLTTVPSTSARPAARRWPNAPTASSSNGCPNTPLSRTTSKSCAANLKARHLAHRSAT
jgi:DDE superfamily endonuclease